MAATPRSSAPPSPLVPRGPVDWSAVHTRLEHAAASLADLDAGPGPARVEAELQRRARELANPFPDPVVPATAVPSDQTLPTVAFRLADQPWAIPAAAVREAVPLAQLTPLPGLPPALRGLANVRSRIVPVFDIRPLLQLPAETSASTRLLVLLVQHEGAEFGLVVDAVEGDLSVARATLRTDISGLQAQYLEGLTPEGRQLLDLPALAAALTNDDVT